MQKLVWQNSNGDVIDLTSGNYGITEWNGFSNTSLNIQSQQVPFQDGGVFLDALMEQRELSVTLAMNDGGNLETRYRLRRELIHSLNPKLGEGYLIYTNDFISKRIKCVAQIPLFETHNSNDSGTPKASLAWTACEPYWEDLEETEIDLNVGENKQIENTGDVPCGIKVNLFTTEVKNPFIRNITQNKIIKMNGEFSSNIGINTCTGEKSVIGKGMNIDAKAIFQNYTSIAYSNKLNLYVAVGNGRNIRRSHNLIDWQSSTVQETGLRKVIYSEDEGLFVAVGSTTIATSEDGANWQEIQVPQTVNSITYSKRLKRFVAVGSAIYYSDDRGATWTPANIYQALSDSLSDVAYSEIDVESNVGRFVAVGAGGIVLYSNTAENWITVGSISQRNLNSICFSEKLKKYVAVGNYGTILTSSYGTQNSWSLETIDTTDWINNIIYCQSKDMLIAVGTNGCYESYNAKDWSVYHNSDFNAVDICYAELQGMFVIIGLASTIWTSQTAIDWELKRPNTTFPQKSIIYSDKHNMYCALSPLQVSEDLRNWVIKDSITGNSIIYIKEKDIYIIVGDSGKIITSADLESWQLQTSGTSENLTSVFYSKYLDLICVVGESGVILTSADALTWQLQTSGTSEDFYSVTYSEVIKKFVACGSNGVIVKSTNAQTWSTDVISSYDLNAVCCSTKQPMFVIAEKEGRIISSKDGESWNVVEDTGNELNDVAYSEEIDMFCIVGYRNAEYGVVIISSNGIDWNNVQTKLDDEFKRICYSDKDNLFCILGNTNIVTSKFLENENLISRLTSESDLTLNLEVGINEILINKDSGGLAGKIAYRQKYIGV